MPANALPDNPKSQCRKHKKPSLVTQSLSAYLITRDSCSWLEQSEILSAKKNDLYYLSDNKRC